MPRFFVTEEAIRTMPDGTAEITLTGADAAHVTKSLRMQRGDALTVCDGARREYRGTIVSLGDTVTVSVSSVSDATTEPPYEAVLYQALVKGDKFDTVVQKAVECGVTAIVPVLTDRCTVRPDEKGLGNKLVRWRRIAAEAAGQCGRGIIPEVREMLTLREAVAEAGRADAPLFCYEGDGTLPLPQALRRKDVRTVSLLIGPEGGFSESDVMLAKENGMIPVGLGRRILRTETASGFVLACLSYELEL
ncbi:MAG: 16S rRNA (uracil(1498)-N(3))-methyltransferase [Clostridia bacterium]|nr:16S rRNA (uracil(1498)-N(3))-methyltransferase [Clostridia bacterium]